jgi:DNA repair exonuclease SbcCD ATPase subunit
MENVNSKESGSISVNEAIDRLLPQEEAEANPQEEAINEPEEEAQVSETTEQEEVLEEDISDEGEEVEDTTDQEDDDEEVEEEVQLYKVKIDGEEAEVTLEEALSGYQRERTFHKRMNEVSQKSKAIEAESAETKRLRDQYAEGLQQLEQALQVPEPNWEELRRTKTNEEFASIHAEYQIQQNNLAKVQQQQQAIKSQQQAEVQAQYQNHLKAEFDTMLDKIPAWRDEKVREAERSKVISYAKSKMGYTDDEIAQASDHRAIVTLRKAMLYDELMGGKTQAKRKVKVAPKMVKAGSPKTKSEVVSKRNQDMMKRFNNNSTVEGAVELLLNRSA